ncbi:VWA domain-containing protein [Alteribacillus sp. HJP-4]|uniref:vWA domain-containing protein n=1 Tax=Alteribacillus sp. HJP-4 TaxID=2775394 RepID=UPI0035CD2E7E
MSTGKVKQILLLTDGCSNQGEDPSSVASYAREKGITVNVIGILEEGAAQNHGMREVEEIAMAGGGVSQVVYANQLARTVQMVTRQAMTQTLHGVVHKELQQILGQNREMEDLPPDKRGEVMEVVDELGETVDLEILILVDTSASMKSKLPMVKEALDDLSISLTSRSGNNRFSLYLFPGKRNDAEKVISWTPRLSSLQDAFSRIKMGGVTPTGPALKAALSSFEKDGRKKRLLGDGEDGVFIEESGT